MLGIRRTIVVGGLGTRGLAQLSSAVVDPVAARPALSLLNSTSGKKPRKEGDVSALLTSSCVGADSVGCV